MSDATGTAGSRGPQDELPAWPEDEEPGLDMEFTDGEPRRQTDAGPAPAADGSASASADVEGLSYEQARDALVEVVNRLERGGTPLEESLALWERGEALAARCEAWLTGARARLEAARAGAQARSSP